MSTLDPTLMATLTDEEREALQAAPDAEPADAGAETGADPRADTRNSAEPAASASDQAAAAQAQAAEPAAAAATAATDPAAATTPDAAAGQPASDRSAEVLATDAPWPARAQPVPRYEARLPEDFDAQVKALGEREADLKRQFKAGELAFEDFELARAEVVASREALTIARTKAEISQEMTAQTAEQLWIHAVTSFMDDTARREPAAGGIDYRKDAQKAGDLDQFVRSLAARTEHAQKSMEWFLAEGHRRVLALHGLSGLTKAPGSAHLEALERRKPPLEAAPKTLATVPGDEGPGDVEGEFTDVLVLEGYDYEQAIARMSPAQRERFLRAA
ncbi:MAG: hypothetical protein ACKO3C_13015 [Betaproteobacteria bacterium]